MTTDGVTISADHASNLTNEPASEGGGMRFEKSELHDFSESDRSAGEHVGILLALVFCISLFLMVGVTWWTSRHQSQGHDPHAISGVKEVAHPE